ncbi:MULTISPECIES: DUF1127 domain-containing protein [unclassified Phyllobacterium]|uniref:DUF1127 domain-containing protein n=1 Tax=unclassified Phyllobacterium TaxID=2638441 RepID=UPI003012EEBD
MKLHQSRYLTPLHSIIGALRRSQNIRSAEQHLEGLDDSLLGDLGIRRNDIYYIVRQGRGGIG